MRLRPFFAQIEAIETLIWLREVVTRNNPLRRELEAASRQHNDGIVRFCSKMATGTGKTAVIGPQRTPLVDSHSDCRVPGGHRPFLTFR